jgi:hypothetical protein
MTFVIMCFVVAAILFAVGSGVWVAAALIKTVACGRPKPDSAAADADSQQSR